MELHYSNLNANEKAEMYNDKVRAEVTRCTGLGLGSGLGPPTDLFSTYLSTYSLVSRAALSESNFYSFGH